MKSTGMVRKIDELGRLVLPKEIRDILNINDKDMFDFFIDDEMIIMKKCKSACAFCSSMEDIFIFKDYSICRECMKDIAAVLKNEPVT